MVKIYLIILIFISNVFAYEINGTIENLSDSRVVDEGQAFNAHIKIWPLQSAIPEELKKELFEKELLGVFKVTEVRSVKFSENNQEVLEIKLSLIAVKPFGLNVPHIWSYKGLNIPIELENLEFGKSAEKIQDFKSIPLIQEFKKSNLNRFKILTLVVSILLIFLFYIVSKKIYLRRKSNADKKKIKEKWELSFKEASNREEYESLYSSQKEWLKELGIVTPPINHFFSVINKHQYKKEWTEDDTIEVSDSFDEIRNIFT